MWVHGGFFRDGKASDYDGQKFIEAHDNVIFVTLDYRTGLEGFIDFSISELEGRENFPDSPNLGVLDVLQAVKWLRDNAKFFGGNPENITLVGQGSGAAIVSLLMSNVKQHVRSFESCRETCEILQGRLNGNFTCFEFR